MRFVVWFQLPEPFQQNVVSMVSDGIENVVTENYIFYHKSMYM